MNFNRLITKPILIKVKTNPEIWIGINNRTLINAANDTKIETKNNNPARITFPISDITLEIIPNPNKPSSPDIRFIEVSWILFMVSLLISFTALSGSDISGMFNMKTNHATKIKREINPIADFGKALM